MKRLFIMMSIIVNYLHGAECVQPQSPVSPTLIKTLPASSLSVAWVDDHLLASDTHSGTIRIVDIDKEYHFSQLQGHSKSINTLDLSHTGLLASGSADKTVCVWNCKTHKCIQTLKGRFKGHSIPVRSVAWSPDSCKLASADKKKVKFWDVSSGRCTWSISRVYPAIAWSVLNQVAITGTSKNGNFKDGIEIRDPRTKEVIHTISRSLSPIAWSHTGHHLAFKPRSKEQQISIFDLRILACMKTLHGNASSLTWSHDDQFLTGGSYKGINIWEPSSDQFLSIPIDSSASSIKWAPTTNKFAVSNQDDIQIWQIDYLSSTSSILAGEQPQTTASAPPDATIPPEASITPAVAPEESERPEGAPLRPM